MTNRNNLESTKESLNQQSKASKFIENTKKAVRDTLMKTWIGVSSMMPTATTTTPSVIPASVNTITAMAPIASTAVKTIGLGTAASLFSACGGGEDEPDEPINPIDTKDNIAPSIEINKSEVDITGGKEIKINSNQLYIGDILVASRSDNKTKNCKVELSLNGKAISSGTTVSEEGILNIKVSDEVNNSKNAEIKLNVTVEQDISGLENLKNLPLQVDQEINLLNGINFGNGAELIKTQIELNGETTDISDPSHYIPEYPGTCNIVLIVKNKNGENKEYRVDNLTIKPLDYKALEINNIKPVDILPIIGQIESGDTKAYEHIEHLRIAEATRIRDMMREYGAGNHSPEEYQQLMMRLNTGMLGENPKGYNNYEAIGGDIADEPSIHAHNERHTLNTLIKHANFKVIDPVSRDIYGELYRLCKSDPNKINIMGCSVDSDVDKEQYITRKMEGVKQYDKEKNRLIFEAGGNVRKGDNGTRNNKVCQEDYNLDDENSVYSSISRAHNKNDNILDRHLMVTFGTNSKGNVDITGEFYNTFSKFPVGFHEKVLFSGRTFPYISGTTGKISAEQQSHYATSHTNYVNVAMTDLCFQMFAEAKDVDELLSMIRSTSLTDYIKLNGQTQKLQLINPAGFFQKYLMPTDIPSNIRSGENINLNKGYYKGVIFDVPGTEVKINGQWIAYNDANKSLIKNQNPMTLEWRLNGDLCKKLGYKGKTIKGKIISVDDQWNGLNMGKEISIYTQ